MSLKLETPAQLATRIGVPVKNIRDLINDGVLDHIYLTPGKRNPKIPTGSWEKYLKDFTIRSITKQSKRDDAYIMNKVENSL